MKMRWDLVIGTVILIIAIAVARLIWIFDPLSPEERCYRYLDRYDEEKIEYEDIPSRCYVYFLCNEK